MSDADHEAGTHGEIQFADHKLVQPKKVTAGLHSLHAVVMWRFRVELVTLQKHKRVPLHQVDSLIYPFPFQDRTGPEDLPKIFLKDQNIVIILELYLEL